MVARKIFPDQPETTADGFPNLPVLDELVGRVSSRQPRLLEGFVVVAVQHLLETTGSLFESLFSLGLEPSRTFVTGKIYSTCRQVKDRLYRRGVQVCESRKPQKWGTYAECMRADIEHMWTMAVAAVHGARTRGVIVLDDGGYLISSTPASALRAIPVRGVEQTSSGILKLGHPPIPVVEVASSAAKMILEPTLISNAVFKRMQQCATSRCRYGVVGMGNIGAAVARGLLDGGAHVTGYDLDPSNVSNVEAVRPAFTLKELISSTDTVYGCTGADVFAGQPWWTALDGENVLASCSSHDQEFGTILRAYGTQHPVDHPLRDVTVKVAGGGQLQIVRGGYPVNFDGSRESVPAGEIQMTRGLLASGVVQAAYGCLKGTTTIWKKEQLSPAMQRIVVGRWLRTRPAVRSIYDSSIPVDRFEDENWIRLRSYGSPGAHVPLG
jgi:S-adenosylhomocysteine hydrolase